MLLLSLVFIFFSWHHFLGQRGRSVVYFVLLSLGGSCFIWRTEVAPVVLSEIKVPSLEYSSSQENLFTIQLPFLFVSIFFLSVVIIPALCSYCPSQNAESVVVTAYFISNQPFQCFDAQEWGGKWYVFGWEYLLIKVSNVSEVMIPEINGCKNHNRKIPFFFFFFSASNAQRVSQSVVLEACELCPRWWKWQQ